MDNNKVGKFIQEIRKEKKLTQKELGDMLFLTDKAISKWERGLSLPDITMLNSLAKALDVDVSEILNGERGKKEKLNQTEIKEELERMNKNKISKKKQKYLIVGIILILILSLFYIFDYIKYNPSVIKNGSNNYKLGNYIINQKGLDGLEKIIKSSKNITDKYTIESFEAKINRRGKIESFSLLLNGYDVNLNYKGRIVYNYKYKELNYKEVEDDNLPIVTEYDKNSELKYLSKQFKKIPLQKQIQVSKLNNYVISYEQNTRIAKKTPIYDGRDNKPFKTFSKKDYNKGKGGKNDGKTNVVIMLYNGESKAFGQRYYYVFKEAVKSSPNNTSFMMETDYYINNNTLKFTRDYGETWINTDIKKNQLEETLNFYRNGDILTPNSWFVSTENKGVIAYFYGENPVLKLSNNNGESWSDITFPISNNTEKQIVNRVVGFVSNQIGYVGLGTDWTMGSGEIKKFYLTKDGGKTFEEKDLPEEGTSKTLIDINMYDEKNGIVILSNNVDINFPIIYSTNDGGDSWEKVSFEYSNLPDEVTYYVDVDKITYEDDKYTITLGQGDLGTLKAIFTTTTLNTPWRFLKTEEKNIHTTG